MAMDPMDREPNVYNRETNVYDNTGRGSNTLAYVIGGLVVALGLLAFLFYDGGSNEPSTTGSTGTQTESSSPSTARALRQPRRLRRLPPLRRPRLPRPLRRLRPTRSNLASRVTLRMMGLTSRVRPIFLAGAEPVLEEPSGSASGYA